MRSPPEPGRELFEYAQSGTFATAAFASYVRVTAGEEQFCTDNHHMDPRARDPGAQPQSGGALPDAADAERELVASILRKDRKAAARFVAAHIDTVYAYARHRLLPRADLVDDIVQEVFLAALNGLATFQGHSSLRAWLLGIARHKVEDVYRERLRRFETFAEMEIVDEQLLAETATVDERIDATRVRVKARRVLSRMPERYGLVLLWRYWEQRSTREMAAAIGTTEKSVERTLARARAHFKILWSKE
jgi:RNA polymerase sigma-70 factor (ECF subfamily)